MTRRNVILKARQGGVTKYIDGHQLLDCIRKPTNAVVISHEGEATRRLFDAVRFFADNMDPPPLISTDNANEMKFPKRGSSYFIGTAGARAFGRGDTVNRAHLSEAAFYFDLNKVLSGIAEAAEYGQIDIESTPNGRNSFYDLYKAAKEGRSPYTAIFIPWFLMEDYDSNQLTEEERAGLSPAVQAIFDTPDADFIAGLTAEEKKLKARVLMEWGIFLTAGQLKWRRYKIWDRGELFFQEYPEDDETCFLRTGRPVFNHVLLNPALIVDLANIPWEQKENERYKYIRGRRLYAGVDCAEGIEGGDAHSFAVVDATPGDTAAVIFEYTSNEPIDVFDTKVMQFCKRFGILMVGVEKQGVGAAHILKLRSLGLQVQEWNTTAASRPVMITELEEAYRKEELIETYKAAEVELLNMFYDRSNTAVHPQGHHDDRVFARAIAWQMRKRPIPKITWV